MTSATESLTYFECFNTKLDEFLKDLNVAFPELADVKVLRNGLKLATALDKKMPQIYFNQNIANVYEKHILNKNEDFLLNHDYADLTTDKTNGIDLDIVGKIKQLWCQMDEENKEAVWKYLQVLVLLNKKCQ